MRTIVNLPEQEMVRLKRLSERRQLSRAELIRRAVAEYLARQSVDADEAFGLWKGREDGLEYQRRLRDEW
jgi:metal-responsive CopG/Arc/MetJ family transcriptional regulator